MNKILWHVSFADWLPRGARVSAPAATPDSGGKWWKKKKDGRKQRENKKKNGRKQRENIKKTGENNAIRKKKGERKQRGKKNDGRKQLRRKKKDIRKQRRMGEWEGGNYQGEGGHYVLKRGRCRWRRSGGWCKWKGDGGWTNGEMERECGSKSMRDPHWGERKDTMGGFDGKGI